METTLPSRKILSSWSPGGSFPGNISCWGYMGIMEKKWKLLFRVLGSGFEGLRVEGLKFEGSVF